MLPLRKTPLVLALGATLALIAPVATLAQEVPTADTGDGGDADTPSATTLDLVVVTATRGSKAIDKIPGAVSVITRNELDEQLRVVEDLSEVLATQVPGYSPSRGKMTSFGESMRGRTPLVLFDGIPMSNPLRNGAREGYFADPAVIERVEVVSGASAVQGLGATGGIINYISRTPRTDGTRHTFDLKYATQFESDDALEKGGYLLEHKQGAFDALGYVGWAARGVGVDGDGRRLGIEGTQGDTQDSIARDVFIKLGYEFADTQRLQLSYNKFRMAGDGDWRAVLGDREAGIPTSAERGAPVGNPPRNKARSAALEWSDADLGGGSAVVQVYKQDFAASYGAGVFAAFQDEAIAPKGTLVDQSEVVADKKGLRSSWVRPAFVVDNLELTTGLDWLSDTSFQQLSMTGRYWVPRLEFESWAPFAQLEWESGPFTVRGGLRREDATLNVDTYTTLAVYGPQVVTGGEQSYSQWVKNLGVVWRFAGGWSAFASYNEGFGLPDVGLVLRAVNKPDRSVDNLVDLKPIVTDNREIGVTWAGAAGSFTASYYDSRSELGSQVRVDQTTGMGSVTRTPVHVDGFEFAGEWRPHQDWRVSATYARTRGKTAVAEGQPLDLDLGGRTQGPDKALLALRWTPTPDLSLRLQGAHYLSRHVNEGRDTATIHYEEHFHGYTLVDFGAGWETRVGEFSFGIENLLDRQYVGYYPQVQPNGDGLNYFAGRGRTFSVGWRRSFD